MYIISIIIFLGDYVNMLGDKIKEIREEKGITQYRLAQLTGINRSTIKRYEENSIKKISLENLTSNLDEKIFLKTCGQKNFLYLCNNKIHILQLQ